MYKKNFISFGKEIMDLYFHLYSSPSNCLFESFNAKETKTEGLKFFFNF